MCAQWTRKLLPPDRGRPQAYPLFPAIFAISRITPSVPASRSSSLSKSSVDDDAHVGADAGAVALRGDPSDQRRRIGEGFVAEGERQALRAGLELFDIGAAAQRLDLHQAEQQPDFRRRRAEAVDDLGAHRVDLALVLERREAAIEREPRRQVGNIGFGDRHRRAELDGRRPHVLGRRVLARLDALDRLAHHLLIELVADLLDVAGLLFAKEIAGAAQVEVVARELEAGAERIERLQNAEALLGLRRDLGLGRGGEIGVGADLRAADAAAQLIELRQAEHVGAMDDHGVGARNVEAGFDDRGRQEDVVLAVVEGADLVLELARRHLAVGDDEFALGRVLAQERRRFVEVLDARADIERLSAAIALAQQRLADDQRVERRNEGAHREPVDRRGRDDRHLAHAGHRQLQRARDRRRRQGQHMHFRAQFLQPLLVADAEMLLLVNDDQAEVLEAHGLAKHRVGADDDVDCAFGGALLHLAGLRRADHARELADADRQAGEAIAEILGMLAREQGRRGDDHGLLAVDRGGEGGAQRDLGLAEADVAADQPVHRPAGGQIVERRLNRALLVRRLLIGKAGAEFVVQTLRDGEARRGVHHALGGDADEFARHLAHALLEPRLARLPACSAKPVELAGLRAVARQELEIFDRQEQPVAAGVVNLEAVVRRARGLDRLKADEAPDAMVDMDDEVAGGERARLRQHVLGAAPAPRLADQSVAEDVLLADDGEVGRLEPLFERDHGERHARRRARSSPDGRTRRIRATSSHARRARGSGARASRRSSRRR